MKHIVPNTHSPQEAKEGVISGSIQDDSGTHKKAQFILCFYCSNKLAVTCPPGKRFPTEYLNKYAQRHGWDFRSKTGKHVCPKCLVKFKSRSKNKVATKKEVKAEPAPLTTAQITDLAFEMRDALKPDNTYKSGYTDESIAVKLFLDPKQVEDYRVEVFGDRALVAEVLNDVATLRTSISEYETEIMDALTKRHAEFQKQLDAVTNKLADRSR